LQVCQQHGLTLYAPVGENDYSKKNKRQPQTNQFTQLPKSQFTWLPEDATYVCPQGHRLQPEKTSWLKRSGDQQLRNTTYRCAADHCRVCPLQTTCTPNPDQGRTVSRLEHEELVDELRERMKTDEAKTLYRLRSRTVELAFADLKQHRKVRCLNGRGLGRAKAQVAATVLAHNLQALLTLEKKDQVNETPVKTTRTLQKVA
jgi:transposase